MQSLSADLARSRFLPGLFVHRSQRVIRLGRERDRHGNGLALRPRILLQILFGKAVEQALHLARQRDQGVPGTVHREIVAAGIDDAHLAPELRQGAEHFQLAGEELLVKHRKRHVLFDTVNPAQAHAEVVHVAAQHAPDGAPLRAARQRLHRSCRLAVVGGRRVARHHDAVRREIRGQGPAVLALPRARPCRDSPATSRSSTPPAPWRPVLWRNSCRRRRGSRA